MHLSLLPASKPTHSEVQAHEYDSDDETGHEINYKPLAGMNRYWVRVQHMKVQVGQFLRKHVWDEKTTETAHTTGKCPYEATG